MRISDWSSDVCSSDLCPAGWEAGQRKPPRACLYCVVVSGKMLVSNIRSRQSGCGHSGTNTTAAPTLPPHRDRLRCLCSPFAGQRFPHGGTFGHAPPVFLDPDQARRVDAVGLEPLCEGEKVGITDRIGIAEPPRSPEHIPLDQVEACTDRLRSLALQERK